MPPPPANAPATGSANPPRGSAPSPRPSSRPSATPRTSANASPCRPSSSSCDVGYCLDLYADFSGQGRLYTPFPDARRFRIPLAALEREDVRETLRLVWADPASLDPTRRQARATRALATGLAGLAASLERSTPPADRAEVPRFLTRCLFCLFAEDAGLLPERAFTRLLASYRDALDVLPHGLEAFFRTLDTGGFSPDVRAVLPPFNGALFSGARALALTPEQLDALLEAAAADWQDVEPAIFGTLLERALDPRERHKLGAHFTPRAYVERLVGPAVIAPLRHEWESTLAAVALVERRAEAEGAAEATLRRAGAEAVELLRAFLSRLVRVRVLDPACGSGNFLYVTLDHLKRLEAEVRRALDRYGAGALEMEGAAVTPANLLGLEVNPQAAAVADLVLWIGYLQWHLRTYGSPQTLPQPHTSRLRQRAGARRRARLGRPAHAAHGRARAAGDALGRTHDAPAPGHGPRGARRGRPRAGARLPRRPPRRRLARGRVHRRQPAVRGGEPDARRARRRLHGGAAQGVPRRAGVCRLRDVLVGARRRGRADGAGAALRLHHHQLGHADVQPAHRGAAPGGRSAALAGLRGAGSPVGGQRRRGRRARGDDGGRAGRGRGGARAV